MSYTALLMAFRNNAFRNGQILQVTSPLEMPLTGVAVRPAGLGIKNLFLVCCRARAAQVRPTTTGETMDIIVHIIQLQ